MTSGASDLRPTSAPDASTAGETGPSQQLEHLFHPAVAGMHPLDNDGNPLLTKVLPAGGPLHPAVAAMVPLNNDGSPL